MEVPVVVPTRPRPLRTATQAIASSGGCKNGDIYAAGGKCFLGCQHRRLSRARESRWILACWAVKHST